MLYIASLHFLCLHSLTILISLYFTLSPLCVSTDRHRQTWLEHAQPVTRVKSPYENPYENAPCHTTTQMHLAKQEKTRQRDVSPTLSYPTLPNSTRNILSSISLTPTRRKRQTQRRSKRHSPVSRNHPLHRLEREHRSEERRCR